MLLRSKSIPTVCPSCGKQPIYDYGKTSSGKPKFQCGVCQRVFVRRTQSVPWRAWLLGLIGFTALTPLLLELILQGSIRFLPADTGEPVDAIVVLGRGPDQQAPRVQTAAQLWADDRAPYVFLSGMTDAPLMGKELLTLGLPDAQVWGERCSQSTWENGLFSDVLLPPHQIQRILLVTDRPHILRSYLVFRSFGFTVVPYPTDLQNEPFFSLAYGQRLFREAAGLVKYAATGKFRYLPPEQAEAFAGEAQTKLNDWKCSRVKPKG